MRIILRCNRCKKDFTENTDRLFDEITADTDSSSSAVTKCPYCHKEIRIRANFWTEQ